MASLDKSLRRKIFYAMVIAFAVIAPLALLYSQGYVFDFRSRGLVSTGGVFVKTAQSGARVFVDSDFSKETSFISHGALVTNLLPKRYAIRVEKDGYQPWQKVVRVTDEEVLEFRNVFLPPATITPSIIYRAPRRAPARLRPLAGERDIGLEVGESGRPASVFIINPETRLASVNFIKASRWAWDELSRTFVIGRAIDGAMHWFTLAPTGGAREEAVAFRGLPPGFSAERVVPHPEAPGEFYFFAGGALFLQGHSAVPVPIAEQIHSFAINRSHIYFVSKNGFFAESDLTGGNTKALGRKGLLLDDARPAEIRVAPQGDVIVRDAAEGLFLYQPSRDQELELIAGNIGGVDFSAKGERMLFWDEHRLWLYWLADNPDQPFDLARTKKQIFYSDAPIRQAYLDAAGTHAFYATDHAIRMVETDDRANVNSYDLVSAPVSGFVLDKDSLTLYWLEGSMLYRAEVK